MKVRELIHELTQDWVDLDAEVKVTTDAAYTARGIDLVVTSNNVVLIEGSE